MTTDKPNKTVDGVEFYWAESLGKYVTIPDREGRIGECPSYPVSIFVAGSIWEAETICRAYCDEVGLCVTVTEANYLYTGGEEAGVIVGLINYPRFPSSPERIFAHAEALTNRLIEGLKQQSATIQAPDKTVWISFRALATLSAPPPSNRGERNA